MPQSLTRIHLHIIFATKNRQPFLRDKGLRDDLHAYMAGTCHKLDCPAEIIGGVEDHVHVACRFGKQIEVKDLLAELKRSSSLWIKTQSHKLDSFYWQSGYGAFSVSPAHLNELKIYIANQEEHHRRETFQDEFRRIMREYGVEWEERYVWD